MAFLAVAETAQDVASGLNKFLDPVSEDATEITALISECFAISSALRELDTAVGDPRHNRRYYRIDEEADVTLDSLRYTFEDVRGHFGDLARNDRGSFGMACRRVWQEMSEHFEDESGNTLCMRLEYYRRFLLLLASVIQGSVWFCHSMPIS